MSLAERAARVAAIARAATSDADAAAQVMAALKSDGGDAVEAGLTALLQLSDDRERDDWTLAGAFAQISALAGEVLGVARAGVWLFAADHAAIECADMFESATRTHSRGAMLERKDFPIYFDALEAVRVLAADDANEDPRTREFSAIYFKEHGVAATLDAPVRRRGGFAGLICCEHVGRPRPWRDDEKMFVAALADAVTISLETAERRAAEQDLKHQLALVEAQQTAIARLSSPVLEVWDGVLAVPLIGGFNAERRSAVMEALLDAVSRQRARHVLLDLTGVDAIDTATADALIKLVHAVRLLGTHCIVSGITPEVAQALVGLGVDLSDLQTTRTLKTALELCMRRR
ncbi:anti-anti-sigma factor [Nannocystis exedens]|uniref:Anti-anti-sigma factor n=1 Tax=Nannocystis exedens TaxID=54 RepID=A0A1I1X9V3_9BACT|nr:STAS domain-containing protein [Nannocystis exedens]PCC70816.1 PAS domain-containing protein [Nannocystis exedens]SFE02140.1 anti-anti-sigma factor [Nannocystis exedens]